MPKFISNSMLLALALAAAGAQADVCLTFGSSTDLFRGRIAGPAQGSLFNIVMIEETFDRATFGSLVVANGRLNLALTKNTNTAIVSYACQIDTDQLAGPCQIQVVTSDPLSGIRMDDVGFLEPGCVAGSLAGDAPSAPPQGESSR